MSLRAADILPGPVPAAAPLVRISNLSVVLDRTPVLQDVSLTIARGEIVTIVGRNGSGKSTLLRSLIGAVRIAAGDIQRDPGLRIGYVPQTLTLDPTLPMTARRFLDLPRRAARGKAEEALDRTGTAHLARRQLADLSGGQRQRVLLARALLGRPDLLLLDEPTQGLDAEGTASFYRLIETTRRDLGCAVVMVSHDLDVVMAASDRVVVMGGRVLCDGTPAEVGADPAYRALFGAAAPGMAVLHRSGDDLHPAAGQPLGLRLAE
ncbi:metal ABC transporter ATP-binding protein [Chachezhania sediminis]|uniref:metal ABC transporter ATP-binding protein n=1 Tax=Chachezhania sediminis TaxID=2599291 RepID=UPI00131DFEBC|nr:metal ABC transporter ATP-binding protein [Chachezhania sediminis]